MIGHFNGPHFPRPYTFGCKTAGGGDVFNSNSATRWMGEKPRAARGAVKPEVQGLRRVRAWSVKYGVSSLVKGVVAVEENGVYNSADELPAHFI